MGKRSVLSSARLSEEHGPNVDTSTTSHLTVQEVLHTGSPPRKVSRSEQKLQSTPLTSWIVNETRSDIQGFDIIDMELLANALMESAVCKDCKVGKLQLGNLKKKALQRSLP